MMCFQNWFLSQVQSNLDYSKCQGPHESFRIIGSSNDRKREFSDIFGKARTFHRTFLFVCFVALRPKSTAMVIAGRSVHLTTPFPGQA